ncbi:hypothetical protein P8452_59140 [Trifolium repens]|nr:hypothetical protein P8452_59140 [Trifolium repens]
MSLTPFHTQTQTEKEEDNNSGRREKEEDATQKKNTRKEEELHGFMNAHHVFDKRVYNFLSSGFWRNQLQWSQGVGSRVEIEL